MPKIYFEKIFTFDKDKLFKFITNHEKLHLYLPAYFLSVKTKSIRNNISITEEHLQVLNKEIIVLVKHILNYSTSHEMLILGGYGRGTHIVEKYIDITHGTKFIIIMNLKLNLINRFKFIFYKHKFQQNITNILQELANSLDKTS